MAEIARGPLLARIPQRAAPQQALVVVNLLTSTLAAAAAQAPFKPMDWLGASRSKWSVQASANVNLLTSTLAAAAAQTPFKPTDFPQVSRKQWRVQPQIYGVPPGKLLPPFAQEDWPTPARLKFDALADTSQNRLPLTAVVVQAPFQPSGSPGPISARRAQQQGIAPNLLLSTLFVPLESMPARRADWPNPKWRPVAAQDTSAPGILLDILPQIRQFDWPNPVRRLQVRTVEPPENLLTATLAPAAPQAPFKPLIWPERVNVRFVPQPGHFVELLTTTLAITQEPFRSLLWDTVRPNWTRQPSLASNELPLLSFSAAQAPFNPAIWPDRVNPRKVNQLFDPVGLLTTTLTPVVAVPFKPIVWANAVRVPRVSQLALAANELPLLSIAVQAPFQPSLGPQTVSRRNVQAPDSAPNLLQSTLLGPLGAAPFVPIEWPTPRRCASSVEFVQSNLLDSTLSAIPFTNMDWPIPQQPSYRQLGYNYESHLVLTGAGLARPPAIRRLRFSVFDCTIEFHR